MFKNGLRYIEITDVHAREILDSRGNPTIETTISTSSGACGKAAVPSGASTGRFEAVELRDGKAENVDEEDWRKRYHGQGVLQAVKHVNTEIRECILGKNVLEQALLDQLMIKLDGTENKGRLGANAILSVSMAAARAAAKSLEMPLYRYLGGSSRKIMPVPMMNILNGGVHAKNTVDFQEFMIMPVSAPSFHEGLRMGVEIYHTLKKILAAEDKATSVGDEGGFAPDLKDAFEVLTYLERAVTESGYEIGKDVVFAMDVAASELYQEDSGMYYFDGETKMLNISLKTPDTREAAVLRSTEEMIALYTELCDRYPLYSIEDGLQENDWDGWKKMTERLSDKIQLVGDDLFVTNPKRLSAGIQLGCGNAILVKMNQIGTLTETMEAVEMAHKAGYRAVISHRSGETEDSFLADLAVACNAGQIKTGAPCRSDRTSKYNRLLEIEEELGFQAGYHSPFSQNV